MAKAKKNSKHKIPMMIPSWPLNWADLDKTFDNFRRDFERALSSFPAMPTIPQLSSTSYDLIDEGKNLRIKMNLPGIKKDEIDLNITDNSVEISAKHKESQEEKKKNFLKKERSEVSYYRTLPLPEKVLSNRAKAKLTDGVLNVTIPKMVPTTKPTKRSVKIQ